MTLTDLRYIVAMARGTGIRTSSSEWQNLR
jgi:hypothetical protein